MHTVHICHQQNSCIISIHRSYIYGVIIPNPCILRLCFSMGWVRKHHACTITSPPPPPPSPSRYHTPPFVILSFPSCLLFFFHLSLLSLWWGPWNAECCGPTFLPVDVSMINRPLTRTRKYIYNSAGSCTGSRNKVTIIMELGSVNLS